MATDIDQIKSQIEYGVQEYMEIGGWGDDAEVYDSYESAKRHVNGMEYFRVVKRVVTEWEVV